MAVANQITPYPFDPTGTMLANRIPGEQQIISPPNFKDYYFIVPKMAPFFGGPELVITVKDLGNRTRVLKEGVDYYLTHRFIAASRATAKPIYGSITFLDKELAGVVTFTYQTIGGIWTLDEAQILEILSNNLRNPRITSWDTVAEVPTLFPVIDHEWNLVDMVGASEVVEAIDGIVDALNSSNGNAITTHIADKNNPHGVNKAQIGLSLVQNYGIATDLQAQEGLDNASYMTPARTRAAIIKIAGDQLANHTADRNNPHGVTAAQVGLSLVQNYGVASAPEAVAGLRSDRYMTPVTTKAVMDNFINGLFATHVNNKNNPHETTKVQIGLPLVENYGMASPDDARQGTRNDVYMTALRVRQAIQSLAGGDLSSHVADMENPHGVNKAQVGLGLVQNYGVADSATTQLGQAINLYTTPKGVVDAINNLVGHTLSDHVSNIQNPHQTTAEQVGAYTKAAVNQLLTGYMAVGTKANDSWLFDGLNIEQMKQYTLAGTAANSTLFDGRTFAQVQQQILAGTAADSERVGGRTYQDIVTAVGGSVDIQSRVAIQRQHTSAVPAMPRTWSLIATMPIPPSDSTPQLATDQYPDGQFLVAGGDTGAENASPLFHVRFSQRSNNVFVPRLWILNMSALVNTTAFGWVKNDVDQVYEIWMETSGGRNGFSVTELSKGAGESKAQSNDDVVYVRPTGWTAPASVDHMARGSQLAVLEAQMIEVVQVMTAALANMIP